MPGCLRAIVVSFLTCVLTTQSVFAAQPMNMGTQDSRRDFNFRLFSNVTNRQPAKNIFISPLSISLTLMMALNGAEGQTQAEMAKTLGIQPITLSEVNKANASLKKVLETIDPKVQVSIANSLWGSHKVTFKSEFIKTNKEYYSAAIESLNFEEPAASNRINKWVKENTQGKIDSIVGKIIDPKTILILVNAIYFKGTWQSQFDKELTTEREFTFLDGKKGKCPMMSQSGRYLYHQDKDFQVVRLPYSEGKFGMYVFLPSENNKLDHFLQKLNAKNWTTWTNQMTFRDGHLMLPRFKMEYNTGLNDTLKDLGMLLAFDKGRADFRPMAHIPEDDNIYISNVKHKSFVEVNEEGTEAAAVTVMDMARLQSQGPPPFRMVVDRPFFFAIQYDDQETNDNAILFMGIVVDPNKS